MMKNQKWIINLSVLLLVQLVLAFPSIAKGPGGPEPAGTYTASDIALSPGSDITKLNFNWHTSTAILDDDGNVTDVDACAVEIAKKPNRRNKFFYKFSQFPKNSSIFYGTKASAGTDENGAADYYCEVDVSKLQNQSEYLYRVGDGEGNWSDRYEYSTANKNKYGFIFVADSQIGASAGRYDATIAIAETMTTREYPENTEDEIQAIVDDYVADGEITGDTDLYLSNEILTLSSLYKQNSSYLTGSNFTKARLIKYFLTGKGYATSDIDAITAAYNAGTLIDEPVLTWLNNLVDDYTNGDLKVAAQACADVIAPLRLAMEQAAAASDSEGWAETVEVMSSKFPRAAFILSGGDQVENAREYEWTGFFSPEELRSLPVAPAIGSHDSTSNSASTNYHFNLPNESTMYGVNSAAGDYYFTYGNALIMVINMDETQKYYPMGPPPSGPPGNPNECRTIDSEAAFEAAYQTNLNANKLTNYLASIDQHEAFIAEVIAANPMARWKIVMWHYSIYSAGNHAADSPIRAIRRDFIPVMDEYDIDLTLMAHDHVYTRTFQMLDDDPQEDQTVGKNGEIINPTGTLYITGATSSGSKYYSLNCAYDNDDPDVYFEYVAQGDDMSRIIDDNGTPDDPKDDEVLNFPSFSYIDVDHNSLKISVYRSDTEEILDTYSIVKQEPPKPKKK